MARKMRLNTILKSNVIRAQVLKLLYNDRKSQELLIRAKVQIQVPSVIKTTTGIHVA
jgi:hypothetical protein